jgi:group I intron endonuclease
MFSPGDKIYAIQHNKTGRIYVGRTQDLKRRLSQHFYFLKNGKHSIGLMQSDFDKYGDDFTVSVLEIAKTYRTEEEGAWINKLGTYDPNIGYNYKDPQWGRMFKSDR